MHDVKIANDAVLYRLMAIAADLHRINVQFGTALPPVDRDALLVAYETVQAVSRHLDDAIRRNKGR